MAQGIHWVVRNAEQQSNYIQMVLNMPMPFTAKLGPVIHPHTAKQLRYAHSLCNALASHHQVAPEVAKRDAKAAYGVIVVWSSLVTGDRTARLTSFADYSKDEMESFITQMEQHLSEKGIDFIPSEAA
jgi:hypothetical protein